MLTLIKKFSKFPLLNYNQKRLIVHVPKSTQKKTAQESPRSQTEQDLIKEEQIRARIFTKVEIPNVPALEAIPENIQITAIPNGGFFVNQQWIPGSVMVFTKRCFVWKVAQARDIKPHTLELIKFLKPKPGIIYGLITCKIEYLIIGTGKEFYQLPHEFFAYFREHDIIVDALDTVFYKK